MHDKKSSTSQKKIRHNWPVPKEDQPSAPSSVDDTPKKRSHSTEKLDQPNHPGKR